MITESEKEAIGQYLEFLLVKQLIEPIIVKHVKDEDVVSACFDKAFEIVDELTTEIANHRLYEASVDSSKQGK